MRSLALALLVLLAAYPAMAQPTPDYIARTVPDARIVGQGTGRVMGMRIYDAVLYAPGGAYKPGGPVALSLTYARNVSGEKITDHSADEMRKQGADKRALADWQTQMAAIFPDVGPGSNITGARDASGVSTFFADGKPIGHIADAAFGQRFFDIWLGSNTADPILRAEILHAELLH